MKDHQRRRRTAWLVHGGVLLTGLLAHGSAPAQPCPGPNCGATRTAMEGMPPGVYAGSGPRMQCPTMPKGAIPQPPGTFVRGFQDAQSAKAEADDFVFYKHEWYLGGRELGPYGRYHLNEITKRLRKVPFPVVIQPTNDRELNETRRQLIVQYLKLNDIPDAELRVLVAFPEAEGLTGEEVEGIFLRITGGAARGATGAALTPFGGLRGGIPGIGVGAGIGGIGVGGFRGF